MPGPGLDSRGTVMNMTHLCPNGAHFLVMEKIHWYIIRCWVVVSRVKDREEQGDRGGGLFFYKRGWEGKTTLSQHLRTEMR